MNAQAHVFSAVHAPPMPIARVAACVCTHSRPQMLARCLASIAAQDFGRDTHLTVIVVDNEPTPANRVAVTEFAASCPFAVRYVHQPRRGIAVARNAALDAAMAARADWIAFIDDDEIAAPGWIVALLAEEYRGTAILLGEVRHQMPTPVPFWTVAKRPGRRVEGEHCATGTTGNVRISADVVRAGLRFDETLGLMGGEDNELFTRAGRAGFKMRRTYRAVVVEDAHPARCTYRGQIYRSFWCAASDMRRVAITRGWPLAILAKAHTIPASIICGAVELAIGPLYALASVGAFKRRALSGGKKIAKGCGRFVAMIGRLPKPYANISGN